MKSDEKRFIKIIKKNGWHETRFGKRDAKYSLLKELPNLTRYHMRLFEIQDYFLILIHHEPTFQKDVVFHLKGFLNQLRSKEEEDMNEDKLELANYQQGIDYFKEHLLDADVTLKNICDFRITETELKIFTVKYGFISLKTQVEVYVADLKESLYKEDKKEFINNIRKLLEIMEFILIEVNPEFIVVEFPRIKNFTLLIRAINLSDLDLTEIGRIIKNFKISSTVIVCSKQDKISGEQSQKYARLKISIIYPKMLLRIFNIYLHTPISQDQIRQIFKKGGVIDIDSIDEILRRQQFPNILQKTTELFQYLKEQTGWVYFDSLESEFVKQRNYTKQELKLLLEFLTFPLINLVLTKTEKRRLRRDKKLYNSITNFDEIQFRLKNIERFLDKLVSNQNNEKF